MRRDTQRDGHETRKATRKWLEMRAERRIVIVIKMFANSSRTLPDTLRVLLHFYVYKQSSARVLTRDTCISLGRRG